MADISPKAYYKITGEVPTLQALLIVNCPFGIDGEQNLTHTYCGWCLEHQRPRRECRCKNTSTVIPADIGGKLISASQWDALMHPIFEAALARFFEDTFHMNEFQYYVTEEEKKMKVVIK